VRVRRFFAIRTTITGCGWFSTGTRKAFGTSCPNPQMVAVFEEGGMQGKPQAAEFVREHDV
jgi:hypothetical protein